MIYKNIRNGNANVRYSLVSTTARTYFGTVTEVPNGYRMDDAIVVPDETNPMETARRYISESLAGTTRSIRLSDNQIESVEQAEDETNYVISYQSFLPLAQRQALADLTLSKLEELVVGNDSEEE